MLLKNVANAFIHSHCHKLGEKEAAAGAHFDHINPKFVSSATVCNSSHSHLLQFPAIIHNYNIRSLPRDAPNCVAAIIVKLNKVFL